MIDVQLVLGHHSKAELNNSNVQQELGLGQLMGMHGDGQVLNKPQMRLLLKISGGPFIKSRQIYHMHIYIGNLTSFDRGTHSYGSLICSCIKYHVLTMEYFVNVTLFI